MLTNEQYKGGENFDLHQMLLTGKNLRLGERTGYFSSMLTEIAARGEQLHMRSILSGAADCARPRLRNPQEALRGGG